MSLPVRTDTCRGKKSLKAQKRPAGTAEGISAVIVTGPGAAPTGAAPINRFNMEITAPAAAARHPTLLTSSLHLSRNDRRSRSGAPSRQSVAGADCQCPVYSDFAAESTGIYPDSAVHLGIAGSQG